MADAEIPILSRHSIDFVAACADAGEMRGRLDRGLIQYARNSRVGAFARLAAGAISDRYERGTQRLKTLNRGPEDLLHHLGLRREEFERNVDPRTGAVACARRGGIHQANSPS